jgi:hypothetical protein
MDANYEVCGAESVSLQPPIMISGATMSRFVLALILIAGSCLPLTAQDDRLPELDFEEVTLKDEAIPYFAVGIGPTISYGMLPVDDINAHISSLSLGLGELSSGMVFTGVDIYSALGVIPNVRAGFSWITGSSSTTATGSVGGVDVQRRYTYDVGLRTVYFDYAIIPVRSFTILPGVGLGWGRQTIELTEGVATRPWTDVQNGPVSPDRYLHVDRGIIFAQPRLNLEYTVTPFLLLRAQAAYNMQIQAADWQSQKTTTVTGVPDGIKVQNLAVQFGVFVGLFN